MAVKVRKAVYCRSRASLGHSVVAEGKDDIDYFDKRAGHSVLGMICCRVLVKCWNLIGR